MGRRRLIWLTAVLVLSLTVMIANAQQDACVQLVQQALAAVDENCDGLSRNSACYGFNRVDASFVQEVAEDYFSLPADTTAIVELAEIATAGLDTALEQWGVAVMSVQANVPNVLPGQNVTFMLVGDVEVENAVDPEDAFESVDPIPAVTEVSANIRSGPSRRSNVVSSLGRNRDVLVDGQSADGEWLRVIFDERIGWMSRSVLVDDAVFDDLPVYDGFQRAPMQSFYLTTGIGGVRCEAATDSVLVVQGPEGINIDLTVNGARIQIGSTIIIRLLPPGDVLEFIVIDGHLTIYDDENGTETLVPEGYRTTMCLADGEDLGLDGNIDDLTVNCPPSPPEPVSPDEFGQFCTLEDVSPDLLNYGIIVESCGEDLDPEMGIIVTNNDPDQPIIIGSPPNPSADETTTCDQFALLDPLGGIPATPYTYKWSSLSGAEWYKVMFWNAQDNLLAAEFRVDAPTTSVLANIGQYPTGAFIQWEVLAMDGEAILCSTDRSAVTERIGDPNPPPEDDSLSASWVCDTYSSDGSPSTAQISWSGADSDVSIIWDIGDGDSSTTGAAPSGSTIVDLWIGYSMGGTVSDSDETVELPALNCLDEPPPPPPPTPLNASWTCTTMGDGETPATATIVWSNADSTVNISYDNGVNTVNTSGSAPSGSQVVSLLTSFSEGGTVSDLDDTVNLPALDCYEAPPPPPPGPLAASWSCTTLGNGDNIPSTATIVWSEADSTVTINYDDSDTPASTSGAAPGGSTVVELTFGFSTGGTVADADETVNLPALDCLPQPPPPPPPGPLAASWSCTTLGDGDTFSATATINWSEADSTVAINFDDGGTPKSTSGGAPSGSTVVTLDSAVSNGGTVADADETIN
ncbi:MAG: SH3 domain-containing protein, partial [Anaerolineae bacterium]|nr:SH3 domain-containing protein [Anaerolineae bacterium]